MSASSSARGGGVFAVSATPSYVQAEQCQQIVPRATAALPPPYACGGRRGRLRRRLTAELLDARRREAIAMSLRNLPAGVSFGNRKIGTVSDGERLGRLGAEYQSWLDIFIPSSVAFV